MKTKRRLTGSVPVLMAAISAAFPTGSRAVEAARVDFAIGPATALSADGRSRTLSRGSEIHTGETIDTQSGRVQMRFTDGGRVSLQPGTRFRVDDYRYEGKTDGSETGFFSLLSGGFRAITGLIGRTNRDRYRLTTSVATIGIRGTEFSVAYGNSNRIVIGPSGALDVCVKIADWICTGGGILTSLFVNEDGVKREFRPANFPEPSFWNRDQQFAAGENVTENGFPVSLLYLPPGSNLLGLFAGVVSYDGYEGDHELPVLASYGPPDWTTMTNFDSHTGALTDSSSTRSWSYDNGEYPMEFTIENFLTADRVIDPGAADGVVAWGKIASGNVRINFRGSYYGDSFNESFEKKVNFLYYVKGVPTPSDQMMMLRTADLAAYYANPVFNYPMHRDGSIGGPLSGWVRADFYSGSLNGEFGFPLKGANYSAHWSGHINGSQFSGSGSATSSGGGDCSSSCSVGVKGGFFGPNGAWLGKVWNVNETIYGNAIYQQQGLMPANGNGYPNGNNNGNGYPNGYNNGM